MAWVVDLKEEDLFLDDEIEVYSENFFRSDIHLKSSKDLLQCLLLGLLDKSGSECCTRRFTLFRCFGIGAKPIGKHQMNLIE